MSTIKFDHTASNIIEAGGLDVLEAAVIFDTVIGKLENGETEFTDKEKLVYFTNEVIGLNGNTKAFVRAIQYGLGRDVPDSLYPSELVEILVDNVDLAKYVGGK